MLVPFWRSTTMDGESVLLVERDRGSITGTLLFPPDAVTAVTSAAGDVVYAKGADYEVDHQAGQIYRTSNSRLPFVARNAAAVDDDGLTLRRQLMVTYTHAGDLWTGPQYSPSNALQRVTTRLQQQGTVNLCITGDSISEGYDSSGFHRLPPFQPGFAELVASGLEAHSGAAIRLHNLATAGWTAADAVWDVPRIVAARPDLLIIAFGMNDACYAEAGEFVSNVSGIISAVRGHRAETEFLLVAPMLPTPECGWVIPSRFEEYRAALEGLTGEGVGFVDVTSLWRQLLVRKDPLDLSGNGLNHPNDFGHRLYAQLILSTLGCI